MASKEYELWGLYDKDRRRTDKVIVRGEPIPEGYYHLVVHIAVFNDRGEMLIQQRQPFKEGWSNLWDITVGGSSVLGESSGEAAHRELLEEVGIDAPELIDARPVFTYNFREGFDDFYILHRNLNPADLILQPEEVQAVKWASREEIAEKTEAGQFIPYHASLIDFLFWQAAQGSLYDRTKRKGNNDNMKSIKAVIFDLDGTLLNTLDDLTDAVNATMRLFSYPERTIDEVRQFVGNGVERLIELSVPGGRDDPNFDRAVTEYRAYYPAHSEIKTAPYPGVAEMLRVLEDAGIRCAVVSNKPDKTTKALCRKFFPDITLAAGENEAAGIRRKPAPDMVEHAVSELGLRVEDCVYVGDSEVDIETANNAGMDVISVLWGFRDRAYLESAGGKCFAETPEELCNRIFGEKL